MEQLSKEDSRLHKEVVEAQKEIVYSFKARFNRDQKWHDHLADFITERFGTLWFLIIHLLIFGTWIAVNSSVIPGVKPFDPYPFGFLTMIVSLEAICLAIIVQISINRQAEIADLREEIDFNINVKAEREITKILNILDSIHDHLGLENEDDDELKEMKRNTDLDQLENDIKKKN